MSKGATIFAAMAAMMWMAGCADQSPTASTGEPNTSPRAKLAISKRKAGSPFRPASRGVLHGDVEAGGLRVTAEPVGGYPDRVALLAINVDRVSTDGTVQLSGSVVAVEEGTQIARVLWSWGDGGRDEGGLPVTHKYAKPGAYTVTVTAFNNKGASQGISLSVNIPEDERINLNVGEPIETDENRNASIGGFAVPVAGGPEIEQLVWDWGDGHTEESFFPGRHTYADFGAYTVAVTAFNAEGGAKTKTVIVNVVSSVLAGDVTIATATDLAKVVGIQRIAGDLVIANTALASIEGLSSLVEVGGDLTIAGNDQLADVEGLRGLIRVGGELFIGGFINNEEKGNLSLANLDGLRSLKSVGGTLMVRQNASLRSITGLSTLTSVGNEVQIISNAVLPDINGLQGLTSVPGRILIASNSILANLDGLGSLTTAGSLLLISTNDRLTSISGLSKLTSVGWTLQIERNSLLTNLDGLGSLLRVGGKFAPNDGDLIIGGQDFQGNPVLANLDGLRSLVKVAGNVMLSNNSVLPTSKAEALVTRVKAAEGIGGTVTVTGNANG